MNWAFTYFRHDFKNLMNYIYNYVNIIINFTNDPFSGVVENVTALHGFTDKSSIGEIILKGESYYIYLRDNFRRPCLRPWLGFSMN